jgi:hypothetical protein
MCNRQFYFSEQFKVIEKFRPGQEKSVGKLAKVRKRGFPTTTMVDL